jgi:hypothetical protein
MTAPALAGPPAGPQGRPLRDRFLAAHVVFHTHVEKAAGSTLLAGLAEVFGAERCLDLRDRSTPRPDALSPFARGRIGLLSGHFTPGRFEALFARRVLLVATVRDPLERLLSFLGFVAERQTHPEHARYGSLPADEAVARMASDGHRLLSSGQCQVLGGAADFTAAQAAAEERYLLVLPHDDAPRIAALFADALGLPPPDPALRRNATRGGRKPELSPAALALATAGNAEDRRLVAWIGANRDRLLAAARARLDALVGA